MSGISYQNRCKKCRNKYDYMTRSEHRKAFKEFAEETQEELGDSLKKLILYGSVARGEETRSSDIDLLVDFEKDRGLFDDYIGLKRFLKDLFDQEIDLVKRNKVREELRDSILRGDRIGAEI